MFRPILPALFAAALALPAIAQAGDLSNAPAGTAAGILGHLDPRTGAFRATPQVDPSVLVTVDGKIAVNITIVIRTVGLGLRKIGCEVQAEPTYTDDIDDERDVSLAVSSSPVVCRVPLNFHWTIDPANDKLDVGITIEGENANGDEVRYVSREITETGNIPSGGATVTYNVTVVF